MTHCEIARYVGDRPEGPFKFKEVVVEGTGKATWDRQSPHNPNIQKIGDQYVLLYIANAGGTKKERAASQRIGMKIANSLAGPWRKIGDDGLILSIPKDPKIWSHTTTVGVNNPALLAHPDGRFFLYYKAMKKGDVRRMGVAIADSVEGPYQFQPKPLTSNQSEIEDGYAFFENDQVHLLTTYNKAKAGYLWSSNDGLDFSSPIMGFDVMQKYIDPTVVKAATNFRGRKFERPQILMKDGKPSWLYVASGGNINQGNGSCSYVLKISESKTSK